MQKAVRDFIRDHPVLTGLATAGVLVGGSLISTYLKRRVSSNTVLEVDFSRIKFVSHPRSDLELFSDEGSMHILDFCDLLSEAATDSRIVGLVARVGSVGIQADSLTTLSQLRHSISEFPKPCYVHIEDLLARGYISYFVLSAFDHINAFSSCSFLLSGLYTNHSFLKNALIKLDIEAHISRREEYKTAGNTFCEERYTEEAREQLDRLLRGLMTELNGSIIESRARLGLDGRALGDVLELGITSARRMLDQKVIDSVGAIDELYERMWRDQLGLEEESQMSLLYVQTYWQKIAHLIKKKYAPSSNPSGGEIAILYARGAILPGSRVPGFGSSSSNIFADDLALQIDALAEKENVRAILLRVDSPGGSAVASEVIRKSIIRAKDAGKKVIVSMGALAASGGYWIAMSADKIVCERLTITGSIGVIGIHMNFASMFRKIGVDFDGLKTNKHSTLLSVVHPWDEEDTATYETFITDMYEIFLKLVSSERNLPLDVVRDLAQGKVYLGNEALNLNLVDRIGGLEAAIEVARDESAVPKEIAVRVKTYPKESIHRLLMDALNKPENSRDRKKRALVTSGDLGLAEYAVARIGGPRVRRTMALLGTVADTVDVETRKVGCQAVLPPEFDAMM